jgi:dihydropteroate synthase
MAITASTESTTLRAAAAHQWRIRGGTLDLAHPVVMGILNVTPDSFYGGGRSGGVAAAVERGREMIADGAAIIDVGGESTRPGAIALASAEELARVMPVIEALAGDTQAVLSIDTRKAEVARAALESGARIVNDVSAMGDPDMAAVVLSCGAGIVLMHMHGEPGTMQQTPLDETEVCACVQAFLAARLAAAEAAGIAREAVVLDPGIGFGKSFRANERLLNRLDQLLLLGRPLLVGASRKGFIGARTGREVGERLAGSLGAHAIAVARGARIIRTHDVAATRDALMVAEAIATA